MWQLRANWDAVAIGVFYFGIVGSLVYVWSV